MGETSYSNKGACRLAEHTHLRRWSVASKLGTRLPHKFRVTVTSLSTKYNLDVGSTESDSETAPRPRPRAHLDLPPGQFQQPTPAFLLLARRIEIFPDETQKALEIRRFMGSSPASQVLKRGAFENQPNNRVTNRGSRASPSFQGFPRSRTSLH